jgi:hypothetical protein
MALLKLGTDFTAIPIGTDCPAVTLKLLPPYETSTWYSIHVLSDSFSRRDSQ